MYITISNIQGYDEEGEPIFIDRIYGGGACGKNAFRLVQKDGTTYEGKLHKRQTRVKFSENEFLSHVFVTDDERWFDRAGMPIHKPKNLRTIKSDD
jgi:hypothetical protein